VHSSYPSFSYPEIHLSQRHESQRQLSQFLKFLTVVPTSAGGSCQLCLPAALLILALQSTFNVHYFFYVVLELVTNSLPYTAAMMTLDYHHRQKQ
jgi:hypothetical protein